MLSFRYLFLASLMVLSSLPAERAGISGYQSRRSANSSKHGYIEAGCQSDSPKKSKSEAVAKKTAAVEKQEDTFLYDDLTMIDDYHEPVKTETENEPEDTYEPDLFSERSCMNSESTIFTLQTAHPATSFLEGWLHE